MFVNFILVNLVFYIGRMLKVFQSSFLKMCHRCGFFIIWYHLEVLLFLEKFMQFFVTSFFSYHCIFLKNFTSGVSPKLYGFAVGSFLDYFFLQLLFIFFCILILAFFVVLFLLIMLNSDNKKSWYLFVISVLSLFSLIITASAGSGDEIIIAADTAKSRALDHERAENATKMAHALFLSDCLAFERAAASLKMAEGFGRGFVDFSEKQALHFALLFNRDFSVEALTRDLILRENILVFSSKADLDRVDTCALKDFLLVYDKGNNNYVFVLDDAALDDANISRKISPAFQEFILNPRFREMAKPRIVQGITFYQLSIGDVVSKGEFVEFKTWTPEKLKDITSLDLEKKYHNKLSPYLNNQVIVSQGNNSFGYFKAPFEKDFVPLSLNFNKEKDDFSQSFLDFQVKRRHLLNETSKDSLYRVNTFNRFASSHFVKLILK